MPEPTLHLSNLSSDKGAQGTYIGREFAGRAASEWANPFKIRVDTTEGRREAVWKYFVWLMEQPIRLRIHELRDQPLLCWCAPKLCHGHAIRFVQAHQQFHGTPCPKCGAPTSSRMNFYEEPATRKSPAWNLLYEQGPCLECKHYRFRHALRNFDVAAIEAMVERTP